MSEDRTKFSLEVVNKSMLAVDLIRTYTSDQYKGASELIEFGQIGNELKGYMADKKK